MTALILFAHGSPLEEANAPVRALALEAGSRLGFGAAIAAFLDSTQPDLDRAFEDVVARGARRIAIVPYFLTLGTHMQRDLPRMIERLRAQHPEVTVGVAPPLEGHPALLEAVLDRANETTHDRNTH
jgi:sirohydrochlorin ferrochelatase